MEFVDTLTVIDMLGMFGRGSKQRPRVPAQYVRPRLQPGRPRARRIRNRRTKVVWPACSAASKTNPGSQGEPDGESSGPPLWGSLAIDSNQGQVWGWSINYATAADADREALSECGTLCRIVMRFSGECAAFAADQEQGSSAHGWANGYNSGAGARSRALAEWSEQGRHIVRRAVVGLHPTVTRAEQASQDRPCHRHVQARLRADRLLREDRLWQPEAPSRALEAAA